MRPDKYVHATIMQNKLNSNCLHICAHTPTTKSYADPSTQKGARTIQNRLPQSCTLTQIKSVKQRRYEENDMVKYNERL